MIWVKSAVAIWNSECFGCIREIFTATVKSQGSRWLLKRFSSQPDLLAVFILFLDSSTCWSEVQTCSQCVQWVDVEITFDLFRMNPTIDDSSGLQISKQYAALRSRLVTHEAVIPEPGPECFLSHSMASRHRLPDSRSSQRLFRSI